MADARLRFTPEDEVAILAFLADELNACNPAANSPKGNRLWRKAAENMVTSHPFQSMRDHFRRNLTSNTAWAEITAKLSRHQRETLHKFRATRMKAVKPRQPRKGKERRIVLDSFDELDFDVDDPEFSLIGTPIRKEEAPKKAEGRGKLRALLPMKCAYAKKTAPGGGRSKRKRSTTHDEEEEPEAVEPKPKGSGTRRMVAPNSKKAPGTSEVEEITVSYEKDGVVLTRAGKSVWVAV